MPSVIVNAVKKVVQLDSFGIGSLQVQEYVEAATLCKFCKTGTLMNLDEINAALLPLTDPSVEPLKINVLDYLLGVTASILCHLLISLFKIELVKSGSTCPLNLLTLQQCIVFMRSTKFL